MPFFLRGAQYRGSVPDASYTKLPRGRHGLTRTEVEQSQRERLLVAMAEALSEKGYARTPVEDVIKRAGVSRETFYRLYSSKAECFMDAFEFAGRLVLQQLEGIADADAAADSLERFDRLFTAYLDALAANPALARLFLIEVHAAGPEAITRRLELQELFTDAIARLLGATSERARFACQMVVAATSALVVGPLAAGDMDGLRAIGPRVVAHVRALADHGVLG